MVKLSINGRLAKSKPVLGKVKPSNVVLIILAMATIVSVMSAAQLSISLSRQEKETTKDQSKRQVQQLHQQQSILAKGQTFSQGTSERMGETKDQTAETPYTSMFQKYGGWSGEVPKNCDPNHESLFLGVLTACDAQMNWGSRACRKTRKTATTVEKAAFPVLSDHTFEWLDMMHALESNTEGRFYMLELGAGWAKWIVDGVALAKRLNYRDIVTIGVEAQPQHCEWAEEHIRRNHFENEAKLVCAAMATEDGFVEFPVANPKSGGSRYGLGIQHVLDGKDTGKGTMQIPALSFCTVVNRDEFQGKPLDFVSLDIQSFEHAVLSPTPQTLECLQNKVKVLHIALHRMEENDARGLTETMVGMLGWDLVRYFPLGSEKVKTEFGIIPFMDGVLTYINPNLAPELAASMKNPINIHLGTYTTFKGKKMHETVTPDWGKGDYITDIKKKSIPLPT